MTLFITLADQALFRGGDQEASAVIFASKNNGSREAS